MRKLRKIARICLIAQNTDLDPLCRSAPPCPPPHAADEADTLMYSRSPRNPALQLLQEFRIGLYDPAEADLENGTVAVREFWENGCSVRDSLATSRSPGPYRSAPH